MSIPGHFTMSYGKYKGYKFDSIPASYLLYMFETDKLIGSVRTYVIQNKEFLQKQAENDKKGIR